MKKPGKSSNSEAMRRLPSISEVDRYLAAQGLPHGKPVRGQVQQVLARYREQLRAPDNGERALPGREAVLAGIASGLSRPPGNQLRPVINATGVVVHTNLGRAVLAPGIIEAARPLLEAYTNLEFDLDSGKRGNRGGRVPELLAELAGAQAALVVNNNAAAVLLMLSALAAGKEVIVSRGELVEIGGAFRVPDIMRQSGVRLVEVGATNRTRLSDYVEAITEDTVGLLKVHRSNFTMIGFVEEASVPEMAGLAREKGLAMWHDLGSGNFYRFSQPALRNLSTVDQEVRAGADVLTLSGDKILGSVQAGIVVGKTEPLAKMRKHPLYRSLRMDKVRVALLEQSLLDYLSIDTLRERNPVIDCMERTVADMEPMAKRLLKKLGKPAAGGLSWSLQRDHSLVGGGALPEVRMETLCLALHDPSGDGEALAARLRRHDPPVIARIQEGRVLLDFRTLFEADLPHVATALRALAEGG
ncbi:MAG: L-seryl-tRNA(Sec) selenium transferase [SAR324 cluster bacterium]|nr:L-seryl-tRNA(Sec) selenium transferase [SAR324 cluster bacterium]